MVRYANIIKISIFGLSGAKIGPPQLRFSCPAPLSFRGAFPLSFCGPSPLCHSERSEESIPAPKPLRTTCKSLFSCTFLCKKVPKSFCTVKMAASVFGRSLSGHGRLTLFRTPAPGAHSLDGRNPAISTSAGFRKNHSRARPGRRATYRPDILSPSPLSFLRKAPCFSIFHF